MAIIDYKEKYEKAVQAAMLAKQDTESAVTIGILEEIFPELREPEDERIRKEIISAIKEVWPGHTDWIDYLEKQGEQKPADLKTKAGNWYICDKEVMNENMVTAFHRDEIYYCPKDGYLDVRGALFEVGCLDVFRLATEKEIPQPQPNQEWSEEDRRMLIGLIDELDAIMNKATPNEISVYSKYANWLNSIKDRVGCKVNCTTTKEWKPSDEQMSVIEAVINNRSFQRRLLVSLYEQLKKLRKE